MSSFASWVYSITTSPFNWLLQISGLSSKNASLLIIGLDNAGKTTMLGMLTHDKIMCHAPTAHPNNEEIHIGGIKFTVHDLGGHVAARRLWKSYHTYTDCILFMVDASDLCRIEEARTELYRIMSDAPTTPILVIGNKIDRPHSCSKLQLVQFLGLEINNPTVGVFMCSVVKRAGIKEAFKWLVDRI
jgi:GTP-binding protein SAR1